VATARKAAQRLAKRKVVAKSMRGPELQEEGGREGSGRRNNRFAHIREGVTLE